MIDKEKLTPTELKIINLLEDGLHHTVKELIVLLPDELGETINVSLHMSNIRKKLNDGFLILFVTPNGRANGGYRLVRSVSRENRGIL